MQTETQDMPLLIIEAKGEIIKSNFPDFAQLVRARILEINLDLKTDDDFAQADVDAKAIKAAENDLSAAKAAALAGAEQLNELFAQIDDLSAEMANARLALTRQIDKRKREVIGDIIQSALDRITCDKSMRENYRSAISEAVKGKRTLATIEGAAHAKVLESNALIAKSKAMLDEFQAEHGVASLPDRRSLEITAPDMLAMELRRRLEAAAAESERKRLAAIAELAKQEAAEARKQAAAAAESERKRLAAIAELAKQEAAEARKQAAAAEAQCTTMEFPPEMQPIKPLTALQQAQALAANPKAPAMTEPGANRFEESPSQLSEWMAFKRSVVGLFHEIAHARDLMEFEANRERGTAFLAATNQAWKGVCQ